MFKSLDLSLIVEFILMFYRDKPIDWLLDHILWVKVCNPEKDAVSGATQRWAQQRGMRPLVSFVATGMHLAARKRFCWLGRPCPGRWAELSPGCCPPPTEAL